MLQSLRNPKIYFMILADLLLFSISLAAAYALRFDFHLSHESLAQIVSVLQWTLPLKCLVFYFFGLYHGMWRYSGLPDAWKLIQATALSTLIIAGALLFWHRFAGYSRAVFLLDGILTFLLAGSARVAIRSFFFLRGQGASKGFLGFSFKKLAPQKEILIIGAGNSGEKILREILDNPDLPYDVLGILDDDPAKQGRTMHGVPVLGGVDLLSQIKDDHPAMEVFVAISTATGAQMRRIVGICEKAQVVSKTLPGIAEIIDGKVTINSLRKIDYQDLLGRPAVHLDRSGISDYITGKTVMVTGCGGSIGSELCRQIIRFAPARLILVDSSEVNLYTIQMELHHEKNFREYRTVLGQVQDAGLMQEVFSRFAPQAVFHAAAYKHVPMLEKNPWQAVCSNILGSKVVMETALRHKVERFVFVSTDKAVRPTNVMGTSKRVAEIIMRAMPCGPTKFMAVRFGNVVGSSGSVIPLFQRQIEHGGPVTVTHPEVTRFFMTIPESCQLILQAGAQGQGGEIFILEMGEPVNIAEMARDLIRLSGKEPDVDIEIVFTGLRDGEKLYEELITADEGVAPTRHEKIKALLEESCADREGQMLALEQTVAELAELAGRHDGPGIKEALRRIVPEYSVKPTLNVLET
jgi:FlaA1/EpsC-like NDP-sugar epimerase